MIVLDTDTLTHLAYQNVQVKERMSLALRADPNTVFAVTAITWFELIRGRFESILKAENEATLIAAASRLRETMDLLTGFVLLSVDPASAQHFEKLRTLKKRKMRRADMLIAAIVLANKALLVTRNMTDFEGIAGLTLDNWID